MTNFEQLATAWSQVDELAPDLLRPIETEIQYQRALEVIDELMLRVNEAESVHPLESLLGILIDRVEDYETLTLPIREKRPAGVLAYLMETQKLTQSALAVATGIDQSTISKLLKEERAFSANHAKLLANHFQVEVGAFL